MTCSVVKNRYYNQIEVLGILLQFLQKCEDAELIRQDFLSALPRCLQTELVQINGDVYSLNTKPFIYDVSSNGTLEPEATSRLKYLSIVNSEEDILRASLFIGGAGDNGNTEMANTWSEKNTKEIQRLFTERQWPNLARLIIDISCIDLESIMGLSDKHLPMLWDLSYVLPKKCISSAIEKLDSDPSYFEGCSNVCSLGIVAKDEGRFAGTSITNIDEMHEVCKCMSRVIESQKNRFRFIDLSFFINLGLLESIKLYQSRLQRLSLRIQNKALKHLVASGTFSVTELRVHNVLFESTDEALAVHPDTFPKLRHLAVENIAIPNSVSYDSTWIEKPFVRMFEPKWDTLHGITLPFLSDNMATLIAGSCPNVIYLETCKGCECFMSQTIFPLESSLELTNNGIDALFCGLQRLRYFDVNHHHAIKFGIDDKLLSFSISSNIQGNLQMNKKWICRRLFKLKIEGYYISPKLLAGVFEQFSTLEQLDLLIDDDTNPNADIESIGCQGSVRIATIDNRMSSFDSKKLESLIRCFPNLKSVRICGLDRLKATEDMKAIFEKIAFAPT
ncbi:hypothetical protein H4219_001668 [Mycoemilia scoparia]|uniref:Uncharacterized protein n=1 Tax=Mycoemilia scoparia TaxID=417184 RepID=A0A9W7ZZF9_9FUNG|nr:hypothetical protein H4219_001668 [Mycoemilia scoparia]